MKIRLSPFAPIAMALICAALRSHALDLYWDGTDTVAGNADGGDGTWDNGVTLNWVTNGVNRAWAPNTANFGGTAGTVSVASSGVTAYGIVFSTTGYLIQNNTITFGASSSITVNSGLAADIASKITVTGSTIDMSVVGGGTLNFSGSSWTAYKLTVNSGTTLNWSGTGKVGSGSAADGGNGNYVGIGNNIGPGTINVTAGSLTISPAVGNQRSFFIGNNHASTSSLNISGGTVIFNSDARIRIASGINDSTADTFTTKSEVNVSGAGIFTTGTTVGLLFLGGNSFDTATINLSSNGTFATLRNFTTGTGTAAINFNGGILKANGNISSPSGWIQGILINVRNGGAIIDDGGYSVTNLHPLVHSPIAGDNAIDGGLTKLGSGMLTLSGANTYTGPTVVSNGVFSITRDNGLPSGTDLTLSSGAVIDLNFTGTNTIKSLTVANKLKYRNMVYSAANLPSVITGTGCLRTTEGIPQGIIIRLF